MSRPDADERDSARGAPAQSSGVLALSRRWLGGCSCFSQSASGTASSCMASPLSRVSGCSSAASSREQPTCENKASKPEIKPFFYDRNFARHNALRAFDLRIDKNLSYFRRKPSKISRLTTGHERRAVGQDPPCTHPEKGPRLAHAFGDVMMSGIDSSTGAHLNVGLLVQGKLICPHSANVRVPAEFFSREPRARAEAVTTTDSWHRPRTAVTWLNASGPRQPISCLGAREHRCCRRPRDRIAACVAASRSERQLVISSKSSSCCVNPDCPPATTSPRRSALPLFGKMGRVANLWKCVGAWSRPGRRIPRPVHRSSTPALKRSRQSRRFVLRSNIVAA